MDISYYDSVILSYMHVTYLVVCYLLENKGFEIDLILYNQSIFLFVLFGNNLNFLIKILLR